MLKAILDKENATLLLEPQGALTQEDFENVANLAKNIAQHFVHAQMKHFPFAKIDEAKTWIAQV